MTLQSTADVHLCMESNFKVPSAWAAEVSEVVMLKFSGMRGKDNVRKMLAVKRWLPKVGLRQEMAVASNPKPANKQSKKEQEEHTELEKSLNLLASAFKDMMIRGESDKLSDVDSYGSGIESHDNESDSNSDSTNS